MRTIVASGVLVVFSFGVAVADDFFFSASKIEKKGDDWVVTGTKGKKKKGDDEAPKEMTFTVSGKVKLFKGTFKFDPDTKKATFEAGDAIEKGFADEAFSAVSNDKKANLYLTTEGDKVTKVLYMAKKKKKNE
jgi:hypothetical protein